LEKYRWYILGGFGIVLAAGAIYITSRSRGGALPDFGPSDAELAERNPVRQTTSSRSTLLLEALRDEMFQLEVEHKEGSISRQEYERARAALDQTLERALKRAAVKQPQP
jgi:hypothetical protein